MNRLVIELIKSFDPSRKKRFDVQYNEFLSHIYMIYDKRMTLCRSDSIKNKYIKERNGVLEYIAKNRKVIQKQFDK
jgi:hypothetical protein|tara:strand:- start:83 stop:310 length:228 start_codon:yes stop_codon:yes gene_type:complete